MITGIKFTDDVEAETVDEALRYFRGMHIPDTEIVKIKTVRRKPDDIGFWIGYAIGIMSCIILIVFMIMIHIIVNVL